MKNAFNPDSPSTSYLSFFPMLTDSSKDQPTLASSASPTFIDGGVTGRFYPHESAEMFF